MITKPKSPSWLIPLIATIVAHLLLLGLLYMLSLRSERRTSQAEEIVLIDLGDVAMASGSEEPAGGDEASEAETVVAEPEPTKPEPVATPAPQPKAQPRPEPKPKAKPAPTGAQPIQTQQHEESLRKRQAEERAREAKAAEERAKQEALAQAKAEAEARARAEREAAEREAKRRAAGNSVAKAFGGGKGNSSSQGQSAGSGNQGDPSGSASGSYSLDGRRIISNGGQLTPPRVNKAIAGRIVVSIVVDSRGVVTSASVSPRGTTIADAAVRAEAIRAARTTTFDAQEGAESQKGTITYIYIVKD